MKYLIIFFIFLLTISLISISIEAETTFFDQDNAFIIGNSITGGTTSGGGCRYKWNCTNWSECLPSGKQTRNCTNIGTCSSTHNRPEIKQNCTYTAPKIEKENVTEKQNETEKISEKEIVNKNKILIYSVISLIILSIIFYLKKDYFKKRINQSN